MRKLFVATSHPRVTGLRGVLEVEPLQLDQVARVIRDADELVSLVTFHSTCDVLSILSGRHVPRHHKSVYVAQQMRDADQWLTVTLRPGAGEKDQYDRGATDFDYTLSTFHARS